VASFERPYREGAYAIPHILNDWEDVEASNDAADRAAGHLRASLARGPAPRTLGLAGPCAASIKLIPYRAKLAAADSISSGGGVGFEGGFDVATSTRGGAVAGGGAGASRAGEGEGGGDGGGCSENAECEAALRWLHAVTRQGTMYLHGTSGRELSERWRGQGGGDGSSAEVLGRPGEGAAFAIVVAGAGLPA
jgi:hypothetical protein